METKVSHAHFYGLLRQLPRVKKEDLVWQYSYMLTTSLSELYVKRPQDYHRMLQDMQQMVNNTQKKATAGDNKAELKRLRSAILHRLQKYGIDTTDWSKVNAFMRQPRIAGKTLGEMTIEEMQSLIPKLQSILKKAKEKQEELNRIARLN